MADGIDDFVVDVSRKLSQYAAMESEMKALRCIVLLLIRKMRVTEVSFDKHDIISVEDDELTVLDNPLMNVIILRDSVAKQNAASVPKPQPKKVRKRSEAAKSLWPVAPTTPSPASVESPPTTPERSPIMPQQPCNKSVHCVLARGHERPCMSNSWDRVPGT